MSKHSDMHAARELVDDLECMGVERRFAVIQAADEWGVNRHDLECLLPTERTGGSMSRVDLDIEAKLRDGRLVHIVGYAEIYNNCRCPEGDSTHRHIEALEVESVIQLFDAGTVDGGEIGLNSKEIAEIEEILEDEVYSDAS